MIERSRSALVVPIPEASPAISELRRRFDPSARAGMPEHVTLLYPFLDPRAIDAVVIEAIRTSVARHRAFPISLAAIETFPDGTIYLAPNPARPFIELIEGLSKAFGTPPYEGRHESITPHLTIGQEVEIGEAAVIREDLGGLLPIFAEAREAWLMTNERGGGWRRRESFDLAPI